MCGSLRIPRVESREHLKCSSSKSAVRVLIGLWNPLSSRLGPARPEHRGCVTGTAARIAVQFAGGTKLARWWGSLSTLVPFPRFRVQRTFYLSSSGGGLPGRPRLKPSRDACLIWGQGALGIGSRRAQSVQPRRLSPTRQTSGRVFSRPTVPA